MRTLRFRVTDEELAEVEALAAAAGLSVRA